MSVPFPTPSGNAEDLRHLVAKTDAVAKLQEALALATQELVAVQKAYYVKYEGPAKGHVNFVANSVLRR